MKIIDLTYPIEEGMTTFQAHWHPRVSVKQLGRIGIEGRESREICFGTHTGTHVDAPLHFVKKGTTIDKISLDRLVGPVTIIDFSFLKENQSITEELIKKFPITKKMIFKFGWGKNWGKSKFYKDYPYFSINAAKYLIKKEVDLLGYDTPSPDNSRTQLGTSEDSIIHKIFLKNKIVLVEYLANLGSLKDYQNWTINVSPLKIKGGDGSPARVFIFK